MEEIIRTIETSLGAQGFVITEGSASPAELRWLNDFVISHRGIRRIGEIGFNAGISTNALLACRLDVSVVSFDICDHDYATAAKALVDAAYPGRHELIPGDSKVSLASYAASHPGAGFDLLFIDGGHDLETVRADLANGPLVSKNETVLVIDDLTPWEHWGKGPTVAWKEMVKSGKVKQTGLYRNGEAITEIAGRRGDRVWATGTYAPGALQSGT
jgi:hypothetical protein